MTGSNLSKIVTKSSITIGCSLSVISYYLLFVIRHLGLSLSFPNYFPLEKKSETDTLCYFYPTYVKSEKKKIIGYYGNSVMLPQGNIGKINIIHIETIGEGHQGIL